MDPEPGCPGTGPTPRGGERAAATGGWSQGPTVEETRSPLNPRQDQCRSKDPTQMHMHTDLRSAVFAGAVEAEAHLTDKETLRDTN